MREGPTSVALLPAWRAGRPNSCNIAAESAINRAKTGLGNYRKTLNNLTPCTRTAQSELRLLPAVITRIFIAEPYSPNPLQGGPTLKKFHC